MLTGLHLLLTYRCTYACDHCFVYGSPRADGTFTREALGRALEQARDVGTIEWIYFEGGEPFLLYPLLLWGLERARAMGFKAGVVSNAYWAESVDDAELWLEPLARLGVADLSISDDTFHHGDEAETPASRALEAAGRLGIPCGGISVPHPECGEGVRFRGRAADTLVGGLPRAPASTFDECPDEDFADPGRVHLDAWGNVHVCQGVLLGNAWETSLSELLTRHDLARSPVMGPLAKGGPAAFAAACGVDPESPWVSACQLCFETRRQFRDRFPGLLGPDQVYVEPGARRR